SGANSYSWDNSLGTGSSHSVSPNTTTTYTVTGTDVNNCENTDQVTITVNGLPTVLASTDETICDGDNVAISASGANSYSWDNSLGTGSSHSVSPNSTTTYTVTGTDGNGCENTDDVTVTVNSLPTVVASSDETICDGDNVTISANGANSYSWDNSLGTGSSHSVSPNTTTTYTVTGTDGNNCENSDEVTITVLESPVVDAGNAISICPDESATLAATGALSYSWDNGLGTGSVQTVTPSSTTTYTVTGTGGNGCTNTDEVTVTVQIVPDNGVTLSTDELTITAVSSGIDYTWVDCNNNFEPVPGETDQSFTHSQSGSFAVIVSNNGCADTSDCIVVDDLSVSSNKINPSITLVPNPTNSITKIVTDAQINKVQVVDFSGKIIEVPQSETKTELDFTNLSRGTYFINIETSYGSYVERVVVM
ncbi:MAG: T9SS type A sorting domain-containing protein, partial [Brumimicrobium sp.]